MQLKMDGYVWEEWGGGERGKGEYTYVDEIIRTDWGGGRGEGKKRARKGKWRDDTIINKTWNHITINACVCYVISDEVYIDVFSYIIYAYVYACNKYYNI